jgi:homoserine kinase
MGRFKERAAVKKTVLLITTEKTHQLLYKPELKKHFNVEFSPAALGGPGKVDAVVYDLPKQTSPVDLEWLDSLDLPVVVMAADERRLPSGPMRVVLPYPVKARELIEALRKLGVVSEEP